MARFFCNFTSKLKVMAIFKLGAMFDAISGKVGGQSLCNYAQQQILKNITYTNKTPTIKQSTQRKFTAYIANSWRFLTSAQRIAWDATAVNYTYVDRVGDTITRNGYQTFCFCNQNLQVIEQTLLSSAPLYVPVTEPKINIIDITSGNFEIQSNNASSDYLYALFGQCNISQGANGQRGKMRLIGYITAAQLTAGYDVVSDMESVFGSLTFPNKMAVIVDPINQTTGNRKQFVEIIQNIDVPMIIEVTVLAGNSVTLPFASGGTYLGSIDWGDGNTSTFSAWNSAGVTHTYTLGGVYNVLIFGSFPKFNVVNGAFKTYLSDIIQFGSNGFTILNFYGCKNFTTVLCLDTPYLAPSSSLASLFRDCDGITSFQYIENWVTGNVTSLGGAFSYLAFNPDIRNWDVSGCNGLQDMLDNNGSFNRNLSSWDVSGVTNFFECVKNAVALQMSFATWDISNATNMTNFGGGANIGKTNYDATLIAWNALPTPPSGITFRMDSNYSAAGAAATARANLIATYGWTIIDNGPI